jgi:hypothetical protein
MMWVRSQAAFAVPARRACWPVLLTALLLMGGCGSKGTAPENRERGDNPITGAPDEGTWKEDDLKPPPYPQDKNLLPFKLTGAPTTNRFYVDGTSLSIGPDKVIRFVLVVRTLGNATTVSYSGMRCATGEWKDYASGRSNGTWAVNEGAQWERITHRDHNNYQETLAKDYFCFSGVSGGGIMGDAKALVNRLKYPPVRDSRIPNKELTQ